MTENFLPPRIKENEGGDQMNPVFPGERLVLENIDNQDVGFPGKFLSHIL